MYPKSLSRAQQGISRGAARLFLLRAVVAEVQRFGVFLLAVGDHVDAVMEARGALAGVELATGTPGLLVAFKWVWFLRRSCGGGVGISLGMNKKVGGGVAIYVKP